MRILNNVNNEATSKWALIAPESSGWIEGKVEVEIPSSEEEYQVRSSKIFKHLISVFDLVSIQPEFLSTVYDLFDFSSILS